jgi:hypothetical protein
MLQTILIVFENVHQTSSLEHLLQAKVTTFFSTSSEGGQLIVTLGERG